MIARTASIELDNEDAGRLFGAMLADEQDGVSQEAATAGVASRIMYLQKIGFPSATKAGRGKRVTHDLEALLKLSLAMHMIDLGVPAARAAVTVSAYWRMLARTLADAWVLALAADGSRHPARTGSGPAILSFQVHAIAPVEGPLATSLTDASRVSSRLHEGSQLQRRSLLLSPAAMVDALRTRLEVEIRYRPDEISAAFEEFRMNCNLS